MTCHMTNDCSRTDEVKLIPRQHDRNAVTLSTRDDMTSRWKKLSTNAEVIRLETEMDQLGPGTAKQRRRLDASVRRGQCTRHSMQDTFLRRKTNDVHEHPGRTEHQTLDNKKSRRKQYPQAGNPNSINITNDQHQHRRLLIARRTKRSGLHRYHLSIHSCL